MTLSAVRRASPRSWQLGLVEQRKARCAPRPRRNSLQWLRSIRATARRRAPCTANDPTPPAPMITTTSPVAGGVDRRSPSRRHAARPQAPPRPCAHLQQDTSRRTPRRAARNGTGADLAEPHPVPRHHDGRERSIMGHTRCTTSTPSSQKDRRASTAHHRHHPQVGTNEPRRHHHRGKIVNPRPPTSSTTPAPSSPPTIPRRLRGDEMLVGVAQAHVVRPARQPRGPGGFRPTSSTTSGFAAFRRNTTAPYRPHRLSSLLSVRHTSNCFVLREQLGVRLALDVRKLLSQLGLVDVDAEPWSGRRRSRP